MSLWVAESVFWPRLSLADLSLACHASGEWLAEGWLVWDGLSWITQLDFTWSLILQVSQFYSHGRDKGPRERTETSKIS